MKKITYINKQWNIELRKDSNNQVTKIDVGVGFNYAPCDGQDTHIGGFAFEIVDPANGTFDLNLLGNMLQSLQKTPNTSNKFMLQTHLTTHNSNQDLNKIKAFIEMLVKPEECSNSSTTTPSQLETDFINLATVWGTLPSNSQEEQLAGTDLLGFLELKLQSKTDSEIYTFYTEVTSLLSSHGLLPNGHPKDINDFDQNNLRVEILQDVVTLLTPIIND